MLKSYTIQVWKSVSLLHGNIKEAYFPLNLAIDL